MLDYNDYIRVFNTGDDALLLERFFDENVTFSGGSRTYEGKAALKGFLDWAHDGVREVMRPQNVLQRGPAFRRDRHGFSREQGEAGISIRASASR